MLLVDDHEHVVWGLKKLIKGEWPQMAVAGTAKSVPEMLAALRAGRVDVVVLDACLGEDDGLAYLRDIQAAKAAVVVLTGSRDPETHRRALDSGAHSVVLKEEPAEVLLQEIERANEWRKSPLNDPAREQDCQLAVRARIAGFLLTTTRR